LLTSALQINRALESPALRDFLAISLFCLCLFAAFRWLHGLKLRLTNCINVTLHGHKQITEVMTQPVSMQITWVHHSAVTGLYCCII